MGEYYRRSVYYGNKFPRDDIKKTIGHSIISLDGICSDTYKNLSLSAFFGEKEILENINYFLENEGKFRLLYFNVDEKEIENTHLFKKFNEHENVEIKLLPIKAKRCYLISDNRTTLVEGSKKPNKAGDIHVFRDDPEVANRWLEKFEKVWNLENVNSLVTV